MAQGHAQERLIIYQILVRQFAHAAYASVPGGNWSVNGSGTFDGLSDKQLSSIRELGCNALWLTGILRHASRSDKPGTTQLSHPSLVKGLAGSPYAVEDFFSTDPDLHQRMDDPETELKDCIERIHAAGMKVLMDCIPNHCARQYHSGTARKLGLKDLGEGDDIHQEFHPQNHFYYLPGQSLHLPEKINQDFKDRIYIENPARATGNDCFHAHPGMGDWYETVKLNYGLDYRTGEKHFHPHPPVWEYMRQVLLFWAKKGLDGFRCDMAGMVPVDFWSWVIGEVKKEFPGVLFIAEIYEPDRYRDFLKAGFDYLYDKEGMYNSLRELMEGRGDCRHLTGIWQQQEGFQHRMLRFLENHDEQRIASRYFAGNPFHALPAFAAAAFSGTAALMLYSGQELGEKADQADGFSGEDGRSSIFDYGCISSIRQWFFSNISESQNWKQNTIQLRDNYQKLLRLCREDETIACGGFYDLQYANLHTKAYDASRIWSFLRFSDSEKRLVICSFSNDSKTIQIQIPQHAVEFSKISINQKIRMQSAFAEVWLAEIITELPLQQGDNGGFELELILPPWSCLVYAFS